MEYVQTKGEAMLKHYVLRGQITALAALISFAQPANADDSLARIDLATFTCREHTDTYAGGAKSTDYTSDRQVYFMIWLAGHEMAAKKGIDAEEVTELASGVLKTCASSPSLKVLEAFKQIASTVGSKTSEQTNDAEFPCILLAAVSTKDGDNYELKTLVAWLSGQRAALASMTTFDFEQFKRTAAGVLDYCTDEKNKMSNIGAALESSPE